MRNYSWRNGMAALFILLLAGPSIAAGDGEDLKKLLQALYDRANAAEVRKDVVGTFSICAPEYLYVHRDGRRATLAEMVTDWRRNYAICDRIRCRTRIIALQRSGENDAVVTVDSLNAYELRLRDGSKHTASTRFTNKETWRRVNGTWRLVRTEVVHGRSFLDGVLDANE